MALREERGKLFGTKLKAIAENTKRSNLGKALNCINEGLNCFFLVKSKALVQQPGELSQRFLFGGTSVGFTLQLFRTVEGNRS